MEETLDMERGECYSDGEPLVQLGPTFNQRDDVIKHVVNINMQNIAMLSSLAILCSSIHEI